MYSCNCLAVQNTNSAMAAESKLWDPPPKNGTQITDREEPSPDWQQLLKYFKYKYIYRYCVFILY